MQHSLFCSDGSQPDHAGYTVSEAPPPYNPPTKDPYTTKKTTTTQKPYTTKKTTTTQKPYTTKKPYATTTYYPPYQKPAAGYGEPNQYGVYPGPATTQIDAYCPWTKDDYLQNPDCPGTDPPKCNLKYIGRCLKNTFNQVYANICRWNESVQLLPNIITPIMILGKKWEEATGIQCVGGYNGGTRTIGEFEDYIEFADLMDQLDYVTEEDRRRREVRDVASCQVHAGVINCSVLDGLATVKNEQDLAKWIEDLIVKIGNKCNSEWKNQMNIMAKRFRDSVTCQPGQTPGP